MVDINDYREEKTCIYKDEEYLVRDNGAVFNSFSKTKRLENANAIRMLPGKS
jgi:hypothetical protein